MTVPEEAASKVTARLTFAITAPLILAAMIHVILTRAGWYDEYYTLYVTRPGLGWSEALFDHWLTDNHPPLYYGLARATAWLGEPLEARRMLNLLIGLAALAGALFAAIRSFREIRTIALFYFLNLAAQNPLIEMAGELRSYFMSYCSVALLVLMVTALWRSSETLRRADKIVLWLAMLVAFNTHIVTTVIAVSLLAPFAGLALLRRDALRFRALAIPGVAASVVFLATVAFQLPVWLGNTQTFWLPAGLQQVWGSYRALFSAAPTGHILMTLIALPGLVMLIGKLLREKTLDPQFEIMLLLLAGVMLACTILLCLHLYRPLIIPKYLVGCFPPIAMIVTLAFVSMMQRLGDTIRNVLTVVIGLFCIEDIGRNLTSIEEFGGWDEPARAVSRQVAACPDSLVHAVMHWNSVLRSQGPPDTRHVWPYAYQQVAKRHGYRIEPESSVRMSQNCPTLFWGQIAGQPMPKPKELLQHQQAQGFPVSKLYLYKVGQGWIASDRRLQ